MEEELQNKLFLNLSFLHEELKGRWAKIAEILLLQEIIKATDFRKVLTLTSDQEKVAHMLGILSKSKNCRRFMGVLERHGFSDVCKKIKETEFQGRTEKKAVKHKTFIRKTKANEAKSIARVVEQAVESVWITFEERMDKKLEEFKKTVQDELKSWNSKLEEKDAKYSKLQDAYADAQRKITRLQKSTRENYKMKNGTMNLTHTSITEESGDHLNVLLWTDEDSSLTEKRHSSVDSQDSGHIEVTCRISRK